MYLEDWSSGYADSKNYVLDLINGTKHLGIGHYLLPDTLGLMAPWEVYAAITEMLTEFPDIEFDFHPHNDYGLATANIMAAVEAGINNVHCTVNCLGERAGNASLAEVVVGLRDKMDMELSIDESHIAMLSRMVENFSGKFISANTPIVGADVFTQTAGIHADGDLKGDLYVTNLSPERFSRKRIYALGKLSGKASLINNLDELGISLTEEEQAKVLQRIVKLGDSKHVITSEDLPFIIADVMESKEYHHISLLNCYINTGFDIDSTASVRVLIEDEEYQGSGSGNGGFDAFIDAIQKILETRDFEMPALVDYEVHIPRGGKSTALTECMITWEWQEQEFKTRGVDSNQVLAAVKATLRMINVRLHVDSEN